MSFNVYGGRGHQSGGDFSQCWRVSQCDEPKKDDPARTDAVNQILQRMGLDRFVRDADTDSRPTRATPILRDGFRHAIRVCPCAGCADRRRVLALKRKTGGSKEIAA